MLLRIHLDLAHLAFALHPSSLPSGFHALSLPSIVEEKTDWRASTLVFVESNCLLTSIEDQEPHRILAGRWAQFLWKSQIASIALTFSVSRWGRTSSSPL